MFSNLTAERIQPKFILFIKNWHQQKKIIKRVQLPNNKKMNEKINGRKTVGGWVDKDGG